MSMCGGEIEYDLITMGMGRQENQAMARKSTTIHWS